MILRYIDRTLRLIDMSISPQDCLYHHPVHKISFIAQDMSDSRAFGYIFGSPDTGHRFFGIKTDKAASQVSSVVLGKTKNRFLLRSRLEERERERAKMRERRCVRCEND